MSLLGIDIGTTGCKAVVFNLKGEQLAISYLGYNIITKQKGQAEIDCFEIIHKVFQIIKDVALQTKHDPIQALSVSSMGEALVPVLEDGKSLTNSILGFDNRGEEFLEILKVNFKDSEVYEITGNLPGTFYSMAKVAWIKKHQPELYESVSYFMTWADYICFMLGGRPVSNHSLASRTLLFDIQNNIWSDKLFEILGLDINKFAEPAPSGEPLGKVTKALAHQLNLSEDVTIVSGGHDQCCAILGSGVKINSNAAMYGMGTFICIALVFKKMPDISSLYNKKLHVEPHVIPGSYITFIYNQSGGALVNWFKNLSYRSFDHTNKSESVYDIMFNEISDTLNEIIVLPSFGATGPPDFFTTGNGCISGLSLNHKPGDIMRSVLEGISFYVKDCFNKLQSPFSDIDCFITTGGGSNSDIWLQITADITGKRVERNKVTEASAMGAAMIAGVGNKTFDTCDDAIASMVLKDLSFSPNKNVKEKYNLKFKKYEKMYQFIHKNV